MAVPPNPIGTPATAHTRERHVQGDGAGASRELIPGELAPGETLIIRPDEHFVTRNTVSPRLLKGRRFDLGYVVRTAYGNPRAAIVTAAVAGLIVGILLKKCLPAAKHATGGW